MNTKLLLPLFFFSASFAYAQTEIANTSSTSGSISYIITDPTDSLLAFRGSGTTFYFVNLKNFSINSATYTAFTEDERVGDIIFGRGSLASEVTDLTFVTTTQANHLDYYTTAQNWPRIFTQTSGGAYFGSGKFEPDNAGRDFIRLSNDLTTVTRPFNLVQGSGVDLINKNIYQVQMTPFGANKLLVKAKRTLSDEEYFVWDDTNSTLTQLTDVNHTAADATYAVNWPLAKSYGDKVVFFYNNQLLTSDGTEIGTTAIASVSISDLQAIGGADAYVMYGSEETGDTEPYLYVDGGTPQKIDINTAGSSFPTDFVSNGSMMMFIADDGTGYEPYISDGTVLGTQKLIDINASGASMTASGAYNKHNIIAAGSGFIFSASDGTSSQLYFTDGVNVVTLNNGDSYNGYAAGMREALSATSEMSYFSDESGSLFSVAIPDNIYESSSWSAGAPVTDQSLYFSSNFTFTSDITLHSLHVPANVTITIPSGVTVQITDAIYQKGSIIVETGGSLLYNEPVNTLALQAAIDNANAFLSTAQVGTDVGQYSSGAVSQLTDSVSKATTIINTSQDALEVNTMAENLRVTLIDARWTEVQEEYVYKNNLEIVIGDLKQAQIQNLLDSKAEVDNLLLGMREARMLAVRITLFGDGFNQNQEMFDYFYEQAVARGFKIFANPAQSAGAQRIACGTLAGGNNSLCTVAGDNAATQKLINRVVEFATQYKCDWINPFNEDGSPGQAWTANQINTIYSSLQNNLNGAELIGPCAWGLNGSLNVVNQTNILNYVSISSSHNLGFNHDKWPDFIAASGNLPVWESEATNEVKDVNNDGIPEESRLVVAVAAGVQGLVYYDNWRTINLTTGKLNDAGKNARDIYSSTVVLATDLTIVGGDSVEIGQTVALSAEFTPVNTTNKDIIWSSNDTATATVDQNGVVTGVALGTATITATNTDGSGVFGSFNITVTPLLVSSITLSGSADMIVGTTQTISATVAPANASNTSFSWSSSDENIATVDQNGLVTAMTIGTVTITASANDASGVTGTITITISPVLVVSIDIFGTGEMEVNTSQTLTTEILPVNATDTTMTWSSSNTSVAIITDLGLVSAISDGTTTITATANDGSGVSKEFTLTVLEPPLSVNHKGQFLVYPNPVSGILKVNLPGTHSEVSYQLFNTAGQLIQAGTLSSTREINIRNAPKGIVSLILKSDNQTYRSNLIVK